MAPLNAPEQCGMDGRIVIVGAGVFGLATALELSIRGYRNITVLDRYPPPAVDGSSVDISRVVRNDYADPVYARMANEAMALWETKYSTFYHRCGFVLLSSQNSRYLASSRENLKNTGQPYEEFHGVPGLRGLFAGFQGSVPGVSGYMNRGGGWVDAAGAMKALVRECVLSGVSFMTGCKGTAVSLKTSPERQVQGVVTSDGLVVPADRLIVAAGAWTNQLINMHNAVVATGQPVGFIQLAEKEAHDLRDAPIMFDFDSGFFTFPPTPDTHVLKVARHGLGYERPVEVGFRRSGKDVVSSPALERRGRATSFLPADAEDALRQGLRKLWPRFADREWQGTRLCWYCDTPRSDFIIDEHPDFRGVFVASGGSGHAFKFFPVIGRYIADCFEGLASADLREKWAFTSGSSRDFAGDGSRSGPQRRRLSLAELARL
ncbi:L-pipecolate oxidase [Neofusicoccum parvum]|uniref:L-pipecolate oxidase n=1 Tax=Neofusicoccum parvum TaxID=310453 RepID=A0ACB5SQS5_9PEZI|nr:L-pipecolate oxidase [Neofusicoccum parvum]